MAALVAGFAAGTGHTVPGKAAAVKKPTTITVTMTDFKFKLSRLSVPTGTTVLFKVVNKGKVNHDFKIAGKKTKNIKAGKSLTLTVKFAKKGRFAFLCTLPGHALLGMKGVFAVGTKPITTTTTTTTTTSTSTTTVTGPASSVTVNMYEYRFEMIPATVPQGTVTFTIVNKGLEPHNFSITGNRAGAILGPNQTETWTVGLPTNTYNVVCDVQFHVDRGMIGQFFVT
ncbi:MAG: cupredoxin domain-containing protein [Gaiellaceae bacterium]